ncbi:MAG: hypothetical protein R3E66_23595, partial [bacterium]
MKNIATMAIVTALFAGCNLSDDAQAPGQTNTNTNSNTDVSQPDTSTGDAGVWDMAVSQDAGMDAAPVDMDTTVPASVIRNVELIKATASAAASEYVCAEAVCPEGKTLLGGGGRWDSATVIETNRPLAARGRWTVCGRSMTAFNLEAQAVCAETSATVTSVRESGKIPAGAPACISAKCPDGAVAVGGGFYKVPGITLLASRPEGPDAWSVCGGSGLERDWAADVLCIDAEAAPRAVGRTGAHPGNGRSCVYAACPAEFQVVGGGGSWPGGQ